MITADHGSQKGHLPDNSPLISAVSSTSISESNLIRSHSIILSIDLRENISQPTISELALK